MTDEPAGAALWLRRPDLLHVGAYAAAALVLTGQVVAVLVQGSGAPTVLAVLVAALGVAVSWRLPWPGLALTGAASFAVTAVDRDPLSVWMTAVLVLFSVTFRGRQPVLAVALVAGFFLAAFMTVGGFRGGAVVGCAAVFSAVAGGAAGAALRMYREHWLVLDERARDALATREIEATRRVAEERLRIARDLHDVVGHQVAMLSVHLGVAEVALPPGADRSREALDSARARAADVVAETQRILALLRRDTAPGDEALRPTPGVAALEGLVASYRSIGLDVVARVDLDAAAVEPSVGVTVYRVVQEALTNAHRHGRGSATVRVGDLDGTVEVVVENEVGGATEAGRDGGLGLVGMRERVESAGGTLDVEHADGRFRVSAELRPLAAAVP
jgi:signal transduction histidine kinase